MSASARGSIMTCETVRLGSPRESVVRLRFYNGETFVLRDGAPVRLAVPDDAAAQIIGPWLIVRLRSGVEHRWPGRIAAGALIATKAREFHDGKLTHLRCFSSRHAHTALQNWSATRNAIVLDVLDNVRSSIWIMTPTAGGWRRQEIALPSLGAASARPVDRYTSDQVFVTYQDFLTPPTLFIGAAGDPVEKLKSMPAFFDASRMTVQQLEAKSADGTRVPYFVIGADGVEECSDDALWLRRFRNGDGTVLQRRSWARMACTRRRAGDREHSRRWRVRAGMASGGFEG